MTPLSMTDWDGRPALVFRAPAGGIAAVALLSPGASWQRVDADDVWHTATALDEAAFRDRFERKFGKLDFGDAAAAASLP